MPQRARRRAVDLVSLGRRTGSTTMFYSLITCTIVYILVALVLTGMTSYKNLDVGDPLAYVFSSMNSKMASWIAAIISVSAIIATASVLLVFQLGQPRIWMSMSRDGLLPPNLLAFTRSIRHLLSPLFLQGW